MEQNKQYPEEAIIRATAEKLFMHQLQRDNTNLDVIDLKTPYRRDHFIQLGYQCRRIAELFHYGFNDKKDAQF